MKLKIDLLNLLKSIEYCYFSSFFQYIQKNTNSVYYICITLIGGGTWKI